MVKLKPFFRVKKDLSDGAICIKSESSYFRLTSDCASLIDALTTTGFDPSKLADQDDLIRLKYLAEKEIIQVGRGTPLSNLLSFGGYHPHYVKSQVDHVKLKLVNLHSFGPYHDEIKEGLQELGINLVNQGQVLTVYLVERLNQVQPELVELPARLIQVGTYSTIISPLLNPLTSPKAYVDKISSDLHEFRDESFQSALPRIYQSLVISLTVHEIFQMVLQGGMYPSSATVTWKLPELMRSVHVL